MNRKTKFLALSFVLITPLSINAFKKEMVCLNAEAPASIVDDLDDLSKTQDAYSVFAQSSDVGFGTDNRYISTYQATTAPTASTMWENYGYIQYALSGQNVLKVVTDESTKCPSPLVFASSVLEVDEVSEETSSNWTRRTYTYILPIDAAYVRILPSSYNKEDESMAVWSQQITKVSISYVDEINDDLDDLSKTQDAYSVFAQSGDVGFGTDNRYISTYQAITAPTASTMWENYGYIQYALSGQNVLKVVTDESTKCPSPLVFASSVLEVDEVSEETSSNWTRRTYTYILPTDATFVRILTSSYNKEDESMAVWSQQITKVNIKRVAKSDLPKKDEPVTSNKIVDELDDLSKTQDAYSVIAQQTDVGFGTDTRYTGTISPLEPASKDNWWSEGYPYIQYKVENQNLVKVVVDTDKTSVSILPHILLVANYGGSNNKVVDVNNYEVKASANWSRITYTFVLEENASWVRVVFSVYDSYDNRLQRWMQQVTRVTLEHADELPEKGDVPTIEVIKKPDFSDVKVIEDDCNELEGNTFYSDFYRVNATNGKLISFAEGTSEYTDSTWWEGTNGYVQIKLDRQNVLTVDALVEEKASKYINPIGLFAGSGNQLKKVNINNVINNGVEDGYVKLTYVYILNTQVDVRLVFSSYNSPDGLIVASSQQITHIKAEYIKDENLPTPDAIDTSHDTAKKTIDEFVSTLNKDAYSKGNWDYILYYANKGKHELATSSNDDEIVNSVKENINNVKTLTQEANAAKEKELEEFSAYFNNLDQSRYTATNWSKISSLYNSAIAELEDITDIEQVKQIIADTKDDISKIEEIKDEPSVEPSIEPSSEPSSEVSEQPSSSKPSSSETSTSSDNNEKPNDNKKGCKGSATTGLVSLLLVAGIALKKKKR